MAPRNIIIKAWLLAGSLDIIAACAQYFLKTGKSPANVLKFVASGVFGQAAFSDGMEMVFAGLFFHYLIAGAFTLLFFWLVPKVPFLNQNWIVTGALYGIFVWAVMNLLILPLSNTPPLPLSVSTSVPAALILICCIDLPLSFIYYTAQIRRPAKQI